MKNKKVLAFIITILVVIIIAVVTVLIIKNVNNGNDTGEEKVIPKNIAVTGKLKEYIEGLGNNYYIKYSGKFKNEKEEYLEAIVEFSKDNEDYAIKSSELSMFLVKRGDTLYTVSDRYKLIIKLPVSGFDKSEYNLLYDINQKYVGSYKQELEKIEYDVEEYIFNKRKLKYYFLNNEIRRIKYGDDIIKIIRVDKNTQKELFELPSNYTIQ